MDRHFKLFPSSLKDISSVFTVSHWLEERFYISSATQQGRHKETQSIQRKTPRYV